ncbi:unnamed protein product, partial [Ectocarpus sp. 12 AP-2014]
NDQEAGVPTGKAGVRGNAVWDGSVLSSHTCILCAINLGPSRVSFGEHTCRLEVSFLVQELFLDCSTSSENYLRNVPRVEDMLHFITSVARQFRWELGGARVHVKTNSRT